MLENIIIVIIVAGAVYTLYCRFKHMASADGTTCGCSCDGCKSTESECQLPTVKTCGFVKAPR